MRIELLKTKQKAWGEVLFLVYEMNVTYYVTWIRREGSEICYAQSTDNSVSIQILLHMGPKKEEVGKDRPQKSLPAINLSLCINSPKTSLKPKNIWFSASLQPPKIPSKKKKKIQKIFYTPSKSIDIKVRLNILSFLLFFNGEVF